MKHLLFLAGVTTLLPAAVCAGIINADFETETGSWADREGPPGWTVRLDEGDQRGIVEAVDFAYDGNNAFRFLSLRRGYGDNRLEQCLALDGREALALSAQVRTDHPHSDLRMRLRVDFYTESECDNDSADAEQIETDLALDAERFGEGEWVRLSSAQRLVSDLGDDVTHMRISLRARDRSNDGEPADPPRVVWFDAVSLEPTEPILPAEQRAALRILFEETGGENWKRNAGWMGPEGTECRWRGVRCNETSDGVAALDLAGNGLTGALPGAIFSLTDLEPGGLDLCWNALSAFPEIATDWDFHLGGDPHSCQQPELTRFNAHRAGALYQRGTRSGEAFVLHMLSQGSAVVYWLTHDDFGDPLWLFGTGRVYDRVMHIPEVFHARRRENATSTENVGRATLVFRDCNQAELRFEITGNGFGAAGRRNYRYLATAHDACGTPPAEPGLAETLSGAWYDPAQSGEGFGLTPNTLGQIFLTWMTYGDGGHYWMFGVGDKAGDRFIVDPLYVVEGGLFEGDLSGLPPVVIPVGAGELDWPDGRLRFQYHPSAGGVEREFELHRLTAGPELLASSGHVLYLEMTPGDVDLLYSRDPRSDERLPGTVDYGSGRSSPVALRFRGSSSRRYPKKSFNIRNETAQPLLFWSDRMNLNAMHTDPSMMREALAFELFRELGQPASRTRHFDFWLNGVYEGLHVHVERIDEDFLTAFGLNPDGTLVRDQFRGVRDTDPEVETNSAFGFDINAIEPDRRTSFLAERFNSRNDPEWERLVELIAWVHETPAGDAFEQGFTARVDVQNFIDWLMLHWLIGDVDSFGDDYWLYLDHDDPDARWMFIPWDKDLSFGSHTRVGVGGANAFLIPNDFFTYEYPLGGGWDNMLISRFLGSPALRAQAHDRLRTLMAEIFPESYFIRRIDGLAEQIEDSVSIAPGPNAFLIHDQQHHGALGRFRDHAETLLDFVYQRYRFIDRKLNPVPGSPYLASAEIEAGTRDPVFLTDSEGYTLMSLAPAGEWPENAELEAWIDPDDKLRGIDRIWNLDSTGELGEIELALYYRNDTVATGRGNWWTGAEDEPVGRQDEMRIHATQRAPGRQVLDTRINPYSNKAVTRLQVGPGTERFVLILPD